MLYLVNQIYNPKPQVLKFHFDLWKSYSIEIRKQLHFIIIDDGSQPPVRFEPDFPLNYTYARVEEDIYWNVAGARNLGFYLIPKDSWVFATDIDHYLIFKECQKCLNLKKKEGKVYWFIRIKDGEVYKQHANTFIINSDDYWKFGGEEEELAGNGGYNDALTQALMQYYGLSFVNTDIKIIMDQDLSYTTPDFKKKGREINYQKFLKKQKEMQLGIYKHGDILNFNWRIIKENYV